MNAPSTSPAAIVSLVCGVLAWVALPFVAAIVAVIAGHVSRADIRQSGGSLKGDELALIGLVLGWAQIILVVLGLLIVFMFFGGLAALAVLSNGAV